MSLEADVALQKHFSSATDVIRGGYPFPHHLSICFFARLPFHPFHRDQGPKVLHKSTDVRDFCLKGNKGMVIHIEWETEAQRLCQGEVYPKAMV